VATTTNPNTSNRALVPRAINPDCPGPPGSRMRHLVRFALPGTKRHLARLALPPAAQARAGQGSLDVFEGRVEGWREGQRPVGAHDRGRPGREV
jgi:hypothetical protein